MSFERAAWLSGPNAQTVFARLWTPPPGPAPRRERWELPDGDFLDVDRHGSPAGPTVVVLHGLEGSSRAPYVRRLARLLLGRGLSVAAVNFRGCSGEENRLPRLYHSGETGDLDHCVARLRAERPGRPLGVAGFSLGGNVAARWLGERGQELPAELKGAAVISAPFDLAGCAQAVDGPGFWAWVYRERFLRMLRAKALAKLRRFPGLLDEAAIRAVRSFRDFDERATAPIHGFAGAEDYWRRASSGPLLACVRRPLLALCADDDPIVPARTLPREAAAANPAVELAVARGGGHVGFVEGRPWSPRFWAERRAADFLAERLLA